VNIAINILYQNNLASERKTVRSAAVGSLLPFNCTYYSVIHYLLQLELKERLVYLASGYKNVIQKCGVIGYDVFGNMFTENGGLGGVSSTGWCTAPPTSSRIDICITQFYSQQILMAVMAHL
jgi:hypothetical protein